MKSLKILVGAALVAMPMLLASAPAAQALTARQYQAQGQGRYISSKGRPMRGYMGHRRFDHGRHGMRHRRHR